MKTKQVLKYFSVKEGIFLKIKNNINMFKAFEFRLYPTNDQKALLAKTFGHNRFIWNSFLSLQESYYQENKKHLSYKKNAEKLVAIKQLEQFDWLNQINSQTLQQTLKHLEIAWKNFFRNPKHFGKPKFKKKSNRQSATFPQHTTVNYESGFTTLCKLGNVPTIFHRKIEGTIKNCTVSKTPSGQYYIKICCEIDKPLPEKAEVTEETSMALDMGFIDFIVASDGTKVANPKLFRKSERTISHHSRTLSRKEEGSKSYEKQRIILATKHQLVAQRRKDFLFKLIHQVIDESQINTFFVEDLNMKGMMKSNLAKSAQDTAWTAFVNNFSYICDLTGKNLIKIDRFFPSSKTCNNCAFYHKDLDRSARTWVCPSCGKKLDRDINAAKNIKEFGLYGVISPKPYTYSTPRCRATSSEDKERPMEKKFPVIQTSNSLSC